MLRTFTTIFFVVFAIDQFAYGQTDLFIGACFNDFGKDVVQDSNGNYYILTSSGDLSLEYSPLLTKLDANGSELWSKKYTETNFSNSNVKDLTLFNDTLIICGSINNSSSTAPSGWVQFYALFDLQGNFIDANFYEEGVFNSVEADSSNFYLVGTDNTTDSSSFRVLTVDHQGTEVWIKGIDSQLPSEGERVFVNQNNLLAAGYQNLVNGWSGTKNGRLALLNYQKDGSLNWKKHFEFFDNSPTYLSRNFPISIVYDSIDSSYLVSGTFNLFT